MNEVELIKEVLEQMKPFLNSDGGDIEFVKYEDGYLYVKVYGACQNCTFIDYTIQDGIYEAILEKVPDCKGVLVVDL